MKDNIQTQNSAFLSWREVVWMSFFLCIFIIQIASVVYLWHQYPVKERLINFCKLCYLHSTSHAFYVFLAMIILPIFGVPITPFFIFAGSAWGIRWGLTFCLLGLGASLTIAYFFYKYCLNKFFFQLIFKRFKIPEIKTYGTGGSLRWVLMIQLIPGLPYVVQNYILSTVKGIQFWHYLSISWIIQFIWAYGFVCGGHLWIQNHWGIQAILFLCLLTWGTRYLYKQLQKNSHAKTHY